MPRRPALQWSKVRRRWFAPIGEPDLAGDPERIYAPASIRRRDETAARRWLAEELARRPRCFEPARPRELSSQRQLLDALAAIPSTTPTVPELRAALGWPDARFASTMAGAIHKGYVETWPDPASPGVDRVMLGASIAIRLGLRLATDGKRWVRAERARNV